MKRRVEIGRPFFDDQRCGMLQEAAKHFPPPVPLLSQTRSFTCVLKRSNTGNGRLVIKELKVKHNKFFHACRVDGRLTLQLVNIDEQPTCPDGFKEEEEEEEEKEV